MPLHDRILMVSGRVSFEIVQKAAVAGVPILCAVSAPSDLAIEAADRLGVTLVGFLRGDGFNVYAHDERIDLRDLLRPRLTSPGGERTVRARFAWPRSLAAACVDLTSWPRGSDDLDLRLGRPSSDPPGRVAIEGGLERAPDAGERSRRKPALAPALGRQYAQLYVVDRSRRRPVLSKLRRAGRRPSTAVGHAAGLRSGGPSARPSGDAIRDVDPEDAVAMPRSPSAHRRSCLARVGQDA